MAQGYRRVLIDLGTGDGRAVLACAAAEPDALVIGIDANAAGMIESSRRALGRRDGLPNALFVVAAAEALPAELDGLADRVSINFPWGSLLGGLLDADPTILGGLARVARPGAMLSVLLSVTERDRLARAPLARATFACLAPAYAAAGWALREARPATAEDLRRSHSTWAKRLRAGEARPVWHLCLSRCGGADR